MGKRRISEPSTVCLDLEYINYQQIQPSDFFIP